MTRPSYLPLNLYLDLDDGRSLVIRSGLGQHMRCRRKAATEGAKPIEVGEIVRTVPGRNGRKAVLEAVKRTKKDIFFEILGSEADGAIEAANKPTLWQKVRNWLQPGCDRCGTDGLGNVVSPCERHRG